MLSAVFVKEVPLTNQQIVALLEEVAQLLELSGESPFKSRAYVNLARQIEQSEVDVAQLAREGRLRELKGVGDALEEKITEYVNTGTLTYRDDLKAKFPQTLFELFAIPSLGPKRIHQMYTEKGIDSMAALKKACEDGSLDSLKGFGPKMQQKILAGIAFATEHSGQFLLNTALKEAERLKALLGELPEVDQIEIGGSLRRYKEIVKDVDLLASSDSPETVMKAFIESEGVANVTGHGTTKSSVVLESGLAIDLRVVNPEQFPYALAHFTGSKEHNVVMRQRAKERGLKLNEYGLFDGEKLVRCKTEADIHKKLGLPYIPPELREDMGEFDLVETPRLVEFDDLKGLIHCHSTYSDGKSTLKAMAEAAQEAGYEYMVICDHSQSAAYAGGLQPARVKKQHQEIEALNKKPGAFRILKGIESDIRADGSLDYSETILKSFEIIVASVHSGLEMDEDVATVRVVRAIENPHTTILGHPTGRLLLQRKGFPLNWDAVFEACAANRVALEINANCRRLDLDWRLVRRAKEKGCMFSIGPDAHRAESIDDARYGVGIARKGWLGPEDLLNTLSVDELLTWKKGT